MPVLAVAQARASSNATPLFNEFLSLRSLQLSRDERPGGSLPAFAGSDVAHNGGSTPIHLITRWPSLTPLSPTRTPFGSPYGLLSAALASGRIRAYHVSRERPSGLGPAALPVAHRLRQMS